MSVLQKIKMVPLQENQYIKESTQKTQIYLHHTAGSGSPFKTADWWASTPERIATSFIIARGSTTDYTDGDIIQGFSSQYWAWHLGLTAQHLKAGGSQAKTNKFLNSTSIGIEICSWGQLTKTASGFVTYTKSVVPDSEVVEYATPFRGFSYYHRYTQAQIDAVGELLLFLCNRWSIPSTYIGDSMFSINIKALCGAPGIWTHTSVRPDKNDCHPQTELKAMLQSL